MYSIFKDDKDDGDGIATPPRPKKFLLPVFQSVKILSAKIPRDLSKKNFPNKNFSGSDDSRTLIFVGHGDIDKPFDSADRNAVHADFVEIIGENFLKGAEFTDNL